MNEFLTLVHILFFSLSLFLSRYLFSFDDAHIIRFDIRKFVFGYVFLVIFGKERMYILNEI